MPPPNGDLNPFPDGHGFVAPQDGADRCDYRHPRCGSRCGAALKLHRTPRTRLEDAAIEFDRVLTLTIRNADCGGPASTPELVDARRTLALAAVPTVEALREALAMSPESPDSAELLCAALMQIADAPFRSAQSKGSVASDPKGSASHRDHSVEPRKPPCQPSAAEAAALVDRHRGEIRAEVSAMVGQMSRALGGAAGLAMVIRQRLSARGIDLPLAPLTPVVEAMIQPRPAERSRPTPAEPRPTCPACLAENNLGASWCATCGEPLAPIRPAAELVTLLPSIEYQLPGSMGGGRPIWRQARHGQTRTWQDGIGWSRWRDGLDDLESVDRLAAGAARIVAADRASTDPRSR
jgi:hypothetical protein